MARADQNAAQIRPFPLVVDSVELAVLYATIWWEAKKNLKNKQSQNTSRRDSGTWYHRFIKGRLLPLHRRQNTQLKGKYEREERKKTHSTPNTVPAYHVVLFKVETQMEPLEKKV